MVMLKFHLMGLLLLITIVGSPTTAEESGESVNEPVCPVTSPKEGFHRGFFPTDFFFGTATASYQVEGGVYKTNRGRSMWDVYCMKYPKKCNYENGDVAVDFFHRYKEDIQLMRNLNTNAFRLSISWPRIFPYGKKERGVSKDGVKFYHDLIDELNNYGITPFVTLFHWDIPQDLEDEYGGFLSDKIVKDFKDYAELLFDEFGGKVKNWITINEPWVYAHAGYDVGKKAPGRCSKYFKEECVGGSSGNEAYNVSHNLLNAHAEAVESFRNCEKCKGGKIGLAHCPFWFESYVKDNKPADPVVGRALDFMLGWHLDPTTTGDYPKTMRDAVGDRLPKFTPEQSAKLKGSADFIGLNYYVSKFPKELESKILKNPRWLQDLGVEWQEFNEEGYRIGSRPKDAIEDMSINSEGLRSLLKHIKKNYGDQEIMIMENGYGDLPAEKAEDVSVKVGTADNNRKYYLWRHLYSLYEAICVDKVNVKGYFVWSLLDNFEWQDGYKVRFGLYFVDFKNNLTRHEKISGKFYREFLRIRPAQIKNVPSTTKTEL